MEYLSFGELNGILSKVIGVGSIDGLKIVYTADGYAIGIVGKGLESVKDIIYLAFGREDEKDGDG